MPMRQGRHRSEAAGRPDSGVRWVREATDQYLDEQNTLAQWVAERCDTSNPNETTTANELWADWSTWAEGRKEYIGKRKEFNDRVERAGVRITRTGAQRGICRGIKLRANAR